MHFGIRNIFHWGEGGGVCSRARTDGETTSAKAANRHFIWRITQKICLFGLDVWEYRGSPHPAEQMTGQVGVECTCVCAGDTHLSALPWGQKSEELHFLNMSRIRGPPMKYRAQRITSDHHYRGFILLSMDHNRRVWVEIHPWGSSKLFKG